MSNDIVKAVKSRINYQAFLLLTLIVLLFVFNRLTDGVIMKWNVIFRQTEIVMEVGLIALAMTLVIATGGIDLSVGYTMALSAIMMGLIYEKTENIVLAAAVCLLTGMLCGALNGLIIAKTDIPPLVTTLATFSLYTGISKLVAGSNIFSKFPDGMTFLITHRLFGVIPYQFVLFLVLAVTFALAFNRTRYGRYLRGMGFNEQTVRFSGVNIGLIKFNIYVLAGLMSSIAAIVYLCRLPAAKPDIGININLETITAVVFGGTSIIGGIASVWGTVLSILILGVLRKGLSLIGLGGDKYNFILGIILVVCLIGFSILNGQISLGRRKGAD
ncbi:MAG: ABC transporter permease [Planctomycetota bacterium]|nr:ABC transporter permease [Planctomycetota bacterium]